MAVANRDLLRDFTVSFPGISKHQQYSNLGFFLKVQIKAAVSKDSCDILSKAVEKAPG